MVNGKIPEWMFLRESKLFTGSPEIRLRCSNKGAVVYEHLNGNSEVRPGRQVSYRCVWRSCSDCVCSIPACVVDNKLWFV